MKLLNTYALLKSRLIATLVLAGFALAAADVATATDFVWNRIGNQSWRNANNWLPNNGYPKLPTDTATFNLNTSTIPGSTNLNETVTINTLTVNAAPDTTNFGLTINPGSSPDFGVVFGAVAGNAFYTENPNPSPGTGTVTVNAQARFDSNLTAQVHSRLTFANTVSGPGSLTINGPGQVVLAGANSYGEQGGTTVNAGSLLAVTNTSGSATGTEPVVVHGVLSGNGTIAGPVTFGGGSLIPGAFAGAASTLTLGTTLFADNLATAVFGIGATSDLVNVNGDLTLNGSLQLLDNGGITSGFYPLFNYTGSLVDNGLLIGQAPAGFDFLLDFSHTGVVGVSVTAVPEPATCVLGGLGLVAVLFDARRARQRRSQEV